MLPLSIDPYLPEIVESVRSHRALVLVAEPGAGKTTRIPPALLKAGVLGSDHPQLLLLQPRRVAARAAAGRMAEEQGWSLGHEVGYIIRFENRVGPRTRLKVLTEGVLTRELLADPFLEGVGAVVLDEFHERSLHTDLTLALLREARETVREDLILVVMSATLDAEPVSAFLGDCPILRVPGRTFPVERVYLPPTSGTTLADRVARAVEQAMAANDGPDRGDILVFLPGVDEIRRAARALEPRAIRENLLVLPLHGSLGSEDQDRALRPSDRRKIILATNVAETSLTIPGVRTVIDSGLARIASFDSARGLDRLELGRISRASAEQRAGRAGRMGPGRCIRLWSEREMRGFEPFEIPEIRRVDLAPTLLALHAWGTSDPARFGWFQAPPADHLEAAERLLVDLEALEPSHGTITPLGRTLQSLPVHPRLGRLLVEAAAVGRLSEGAALAAILAEKDFVLPSDRTGVSRSPLADRASSSDLIARLDLLNGAEQSRFSGSLRNRGIDPRAAKQVARVRDDLIRISRHLPRRAARRDPENPREPDDETELVRCLLLAYPDRVCRRRGQEPGLGTMVGGRGVRLSPESSVREAELFLAHDPRDERRAGVREARVRLASAIELPWLEELFPGQVLREDVARFDSERRRVVGLRRLRFRDLILAEEPNQAVDSVEAARVLHAALADDPVAFVRSNEDAAAWLDRLAFLQSALSEVQWPDMGPATMNQILEYACIGKRSEEEAQKVPLVPLLSNVLDREQLHLLQTEAPEAIQVPSGNRIRLRYEPNCPPVLAVRLQEVFGWTETPRLARGRVPILIHLLGPNLRPVQITRDLQSFWNTTYHQVRKDLRGRYPKHSWPEDPWTAKAEARGGRRSSS